MRVCLCGVCEGGSEYGEPAGGGAEGEWVGSSILGGIELSSAEERAAGVRIW